MENSDTFEKLLHDYKKMKAALEDIVNWNDKLEFEYDDIGSNPGLLLHPSTGTGAGRPRNNI